MDVIEEDDEGNLIESERVTSMVLSSQPMSQKKKSKHSIELGQM